MILSQMREVPSISIKCPLLDTWKNDHDVNDGDSNIKDDDD